MSILHYVIKFLKFDLHVTVSVSGFYKLKLIRCYLETLCEALKHRSRIALGPFSYANRFEVAIFTLDSIGPRRKTLLRR